MNQKLFRNLLLRVNTYFLQITNFNYIIYQVAAFTNKSLIYIGCLASIKFETFFTLVTKDFEIVSKSNFNNEIGLQLKYIFYVY